MVQSLGLWAAAAFAATVAATATPIDDSCAKGTNGTGGVDCEPCAAGRFAPWLGMSECKECKKGKFSVNGSFWCDECPVGKYQSSTGLGECEHCEIGRYQKWEGKTNCYHCPSGKYQDKLKYHVCHGCPTGEWTDGKEGKTQCWLIPTGFPTAYPTAAPSATPSAAPTAAPSAAPTTAPTGAPSEYPTAAPTATPTAACMPGYWGSGDATCQSCPVGKFSLVYNSAACTSCDKGRYNPDPARALDCIACPSGKFQANATQTDCTGCDIGKFHGNSEVAAFAESHCSHCPDGQFQHVSGSEECYFCPSGKFSKSPNKKDVCHSCTGTDILRYQWTENKAGWDHCVDHPLDCKMDAWGGYSTCTKTCYTSSDSIAALRCCQDNIAVCKACKADTTVPRFCKDFPGYAGCEAYPNTVADYSADVAATPAPTPIQGFGDQVRFAAPEYHAWGGGRECAVSFARHGHDQDFVRWDNATTRWEQKSRCNQQECPVDCVASAYGLWGACSKADGVIAKCSGGTTTRTRHVTVPNFAGGKACPSMSENKECNVHDCLDAVCHEEHVTCKTRTHTYLGAASNETCASALDCANKGLVRSVAVTHLNGFMHMHSQFSCKAKASGVNGTWGKDQCVCRCAKHPTACYQKNKVFTNAWIDGNMFFNQTLNGCSALCNSHPECTAWEFDSKRKCVLKSGSPSVVDNPHTDITTYVGQKSGEKGCVQNPPPWCLMDHYKFTDPATDNQYCLKCPAGKHADAGTSNPDCV